ncbi:MAG TPA: hypothetical protein PLO37_12020 [Candidatus Hydrogenedentes bacterium]|nr:hypothetical protein [Candidatus Hydrogenedentota bacterium]HPG67568.1 hypothetical protein [Candidatus Hydrogenedentota bacterium]
MADPSIENAIAPTPRVVFLRLALVFAAVHAIFYGLGGRFDATTLDEIMHFMDPELLRHRLIETCFYLHIQPPLMNLLVGLVLKLPAAVGWAIFHSAFLVFGLTLYLSVFLLQVRLGVSQRIAAVLATLFLASPSFLVFEHWLFYTFPCGMLLAVASLLLFEVLDRRRSWAIAGFALAVMTLCGLRSMFHLLYFVLVLAVGLIFCPGYRQRVLALSLVPLLLVAAVYAKNYAVFGRFSACTFSGKNLWIMTVGNLSWPQREALIESGAISELSRINRWSSVDEYPTPYRAVRGFEGVPVLRQTHKSTGGVNYNHLATIAISDQYGKDARYVLLHHPRAFLIAVAISSFRYFAPATTLPVSSGNREALRWPMAFYDNVLYGRWPFDTTSCRFLEMAQAVPYVFLLIGLPAAVLYGLIAAARGQAGPARLSRTQRIVILYLCFNIVFVAVMGCCLDARETSRYRFMTDGLSVALIGLLAQRIIAALRAKRTA